MTSYLLKNNNLVIPYRAESDGIIGDGLLLISPAHPDYARRRNTAQPAPPAIEAEFGKQTPTS